MDFIRSHQVDIMLALSSICFIILVFLAMTNFLSKAKKKALLFFVFSTALLLLTGRYSFIFQGQTTSSAIVLAKIFKYLMFFNILNVVYGFGEYIKYIYVENHPNLKVPKLFNVIKVIIIIGHIFLFVSQFTNFYYSYDMYNVYHREKWYFLCYAFPLSATILQYVIIAPELKKAKKHISIPLVLYFILPIIASIIQLFIPGLSIVIIIIGGVVIILYSFTIYDANVMLKEKEKNEADLRLAKEIQQNEIPNIFPAFPNKNEFDLYASMNPAKQIGGDFYDYFLIDDDHLGLVIADVSGKGVSAALNMVKVKILLKGTGIHLNDPAKVLTSVNKEFTDNNKLDIFVTIWYGILELSTGKLTFTNAGHEDAIIYKEKKVFDTHKTKHGIPVGSLKNYEYQNNEIKLSKGDKIFLYTDGVTDAINSDNKKYGIDNLLKLLNDNKDKSVNDLINLVKEGINMHSKGCEQFDDITMLCVELNDKKDKNIIKISKKINADLNEIPNVYDYFTKQIKDIISIENVKKYYIVFDEVLSNIIKYGFVDTNNKYINIIFTIDSKNKNIKITFEDNGIPFNPLDIKNPNTKLSAEERKEGGLGIYIVKKMMDKVSYKYKDGKNILIIEKKY